MRSLVLVLLALGCSPSDPAAPPGLDTGTVGDTDAPDPSTEEPTDPELGADEALVRQLIAGELTPEDVIVPVAWSGGWPVATADGTLLFVHWYDGGDWSVAGDFNEWALQPMTPGDGFWWAEVTLEPTPGQRYKLVNGGADWVADPFARAYTYDDFGEISYLRPPTDTWRIDRWPALQAEALVARDVRVYVPPGQGPWPVLYAHDGQNLFDPGALWGGWRLQDALAGLDPVLVVGIDNTVDRMDEYTHVVDDIGWGAPIGGAADRYAALVHEHLRPQVEATYGSTGHNGVMGSSLGGLVSLYIAHAYPGEYAFAASLSGTLGWGVYDGAGPAMEALYTSAGHRDTALYLDSGGGPGADGVCLDLDGDGYPEDDPDGSDNYCVTRQFADAMAGLGYTWEVDLWHWHEAGAPHNEAAWSDRVFRPLGLFLSLLD